MKKLTLITLLGLLFTIAGCNTIRGAGQDVEAVGDAVADTAEDAKRNIND